MKICCRCNQIKPFEDFNKLLKAKDGLKYYCRECQTIEYYKNQEQNIKQKRLYYQNNKETFSQKAKEYRNKNATKLKEKRKNYYNNNKEKFLQKQKAYRSRDDVKARRNQLERERKANDRFFAIIANLRTRLSEILSGKRTNRAGSTKKLLGCDLITLKKYLESYFLPGMSWDNYGRDGWVCDHTIPCEAFGPLTEENQRKCFHYSNLKPMWESDNCSKAAVFELNGQIIDAKINKNIDPIALESLWLENKAKAELRMKEFPNTKIPV